MSTLRHIKLTGVYTQRVEHVTSPMFRISDCIYFGLWQPTPVFLPGESQGRQSLVGCHLWGHKESNTTEAT